MESLEFSRDSHISLAFQGPIKSPVSMIDWEEGRSYSRRCRLSNALFAFLHTGGNNRALRRGSTSIGPTARSAAPSLHWSSTAPIDSFAASWRKMDSHRWHFNVLTYHHQMTKSGQYFVLGFQTIYFLLCLAFRLDQSEVLGLRVGLRCN